MVDPAKNYTKENSALDLMGLGGDDQPDDFEEYDENESLKIKDTTFNSDQRGSVLYAHLGAGKPPN